MLVALYLASHAQWRQQVLKLRQEGIEWKDQHDKMLVTGLSKFLVGPELLPKQTRVVQCDGLR
eukprot:1144736-Pelagomonas_calceolata.AAC.2